MKPECAAELGVPAVDYIEPGQKFPIGVCITGYAWVAEHGPWGGWFDNPYDAIQDAPPGARIVMRKVHQELYGRKAEPTEEKK